MYIFSPLWDSRECISVVFKLKTTATGKTFPSVNCACYSNSLSTGRKAYWDGRAFQKWMFLPEAGGRYDYRRGFPAASQWNGKHHSPREGKEKGEKRALDLACRLESGAPWYISWGSQTATHPGTNRTLTCSAAVRRLHHIP